MTFEEILELKNGELNKLTAIHIMKYEPLTVGYFGTESETQRQKELADWMDRVQLQDVGNYYVVEKENFYLEKDYWNPSTEFNDAWKVFQEMRNKLFSKRRACMGYLRQIIKEEVGMDVAWPDAFWLMAPDKICRAALCVELIK